MELDDELCLCFHVTKRKVVNYLRVEKPKRAGQLSQCFGAGTGCGWCRPFLQRLFEAAVANGATSPDLPTPEDYARQRAQYIEKKDARPPQNSDPQNSAGQSTIGENAPSPTLESQKADSQKTDSQT